MSLTSHLRDPKSPIGQFITQRFPQTSSITTVTNKRLRDLRTVNPGFPSWVYSHLGMAIDYRIRYSFAITPRRHLTAWLGAPGLAVKPWESDDDIPFDWDEVPKGIGIPMPSGSNGLAVEIAQGPYSLKLIISFFDSLDATLQAIQPIGRRLEPVEEGILARYCFVLGLFEEIFRSDRYLDGPLLVPAPRKSVDELLAIPDDAWVDDLRALSYLFYDKYSYLLSLPFILNPTFMGSGDVGGADADLIVNGCLIDIKTTIGPKIDAKHLRQLVGYVLLDYDDARHIDSVGIYMARQGELFTWPLTDFLCQLTGDSTTSVIQLRQEFRSLFKSKRSSLRT
jgi:hypothetical protein